MSVRAIEVVVDIRRFPGSRNAHFTSDEMPRWLAERGVDHRWLAAHGVDYRWLTALGGPRKRAPDSPDRWPCRL